MLEVGLRIVFPHKGWADFEGPTNESKKVYVYLTDEGRKIYTYVHTRRVTYSHAKGLIPHGKDGELVMLATSNTTKRVIE